MKWLIFLLVSFCMWSCQTEIKLPEKPKDLIPIPEIHTIIADISILESCIDGEFGQMSKYYKIVDASIEDYLKRRGVDTTTLRTTLDYYHGHQTKGTKLYQAVNDTLANRFSKLKSSLPEMELNELD